jgi:predicted flavoprotein YhiN
MKVTTFLSTYLPKRFIEGLFENYIDDVLAQKNLADLSNKDFATLHDYIGAWHIKPNGSEGYRTAEVTRGGVNVDEIDAKTFESKLQKNLYFIGEVLDVTGHLGGHNFQWAWANGYCCGRGV